MSGDCEGVWPTIPEKALHPARVPMIEALWRIGEPLSAIDLVDVLDGFVSMWEATHHLRALEALNVVEPCLSQEGSAGSKRDQFIVPYRLRRASDDVC